MDSQSDICDFKGFSASDIEEFNGSDIDVSPVSTLDVCDFESDDEDLFCAIQNSLRDGDFLYDWM